MNSKMRAEAEKAERLSNYLSAHEWDEIKEELKKEIYQTQANLLDSAKDWDSVCRAQGYCQALAMIINLREIQQSYLDQITETQHAAQDV